MSFFSLDSIKPPGIFRPKTREVNFGNNAEDFKIFTWVLGNVCNYACSYCPDDLHNGKHRFPKLEVAIDIFKKFRGDSPVYYELLGGEPTYWPGLQDYIHAIADENTFIELNTNGSRSAKYWNSFDAKVDIFYISFHPESANEKEFTETLEILSEKYRVYVAFLAHPQHWQKVERFYRYIGFERTDLKVNCFLSMIRPNFGEKVIDGLTEEMKALWKNPPERRALKVDQNIPRFFTYNDRKVEWRNFSLNRLNQFKGMDCNIPNQRLFIGPNGDMYYASCKEGGKIGNAYTEEYDLSRTAPITCGLDFCGCKLDAIIPKKGPYPHNLPDGVFFENS